MKAVAIACGALLWVAVSSCRGPAPATVAGEDADHQPAATQDVVMLASKTAGNEIVLTRTFMAGREDVFAAMTQPVHLLQWPE